MKTIQLAFLAVCLLAISSVEGQQKLPEPVPILKQISKQNDDGSYSFGYEGGDGSFKIETKYPDGSVQGKYGYIDDSGNLREVEYGASKNRGFEPSGSDINVPPPTLSNNAKLNPLADGEEDDGQYREDPSIYDTKEYRANLPVKSAARRPATQFKFQQEPIQQAQPVYQQPAQNSYTTFEQPAKQTFASYQQPATRKPFSGVQHRFHQPVFQDYQQPQQQSFSSYVQPQQQTFSSFVQPQQQTFSNYVQPQQQAVSNYVQPQQTYSNYQQPQYTSYTQPQAQSQQYTYNGHPSVRDFNVGTGSYSINYKR